MTIDRGSAKALSTQLAEDLKREISSGTYSVGDRLPSLNDLSVRYGVAELTAHTAVKDLQREGIVESVQGRGTFVRSVPTSGQADTTDAPLGVQVSKLQAEVTELRAQVEVLTDRLDAATNTAE